MKKPFIIVVVILLITLAQGILGQSTSKKLARDGKAQCMDCSGVSQLYVSLDSMAQAIRGLSDLQAQVEQLTGEVERLTEEVERKTGEVERLTGEVERLTSKDGQLDEKIDEKQEQDLYIACE